MAYIGTKMARDAYAPALGSTGADGDISPLQAVQIVINMLERPQPYMVWEMFGQSKPLDANTGDTLMFSRMKDLPLVTTGLPEGEDPAVRKLTRLDFPLKLTQLGDIVGFSDRVEDLGDKRVITAGEKVCGDCAGRSIEKLRTGMLESGTSVFWANGGARSAVNTPPTKATLSRIERYLDGRNARCITSYIAPGAGYESRPVPPCYICVHHTDLKQDIQGLDGFIPVQKYAQRSPWPNEYGSLGQIRFLTSTLLTPWTGASGGGAPGATVLSTDASHADVYPMYIFGEDAYAISAFKGVGAIQPSVFPANKKDKSDMLGLRGYIAWKAWAGARILNDDWFVRYEVACSK